MPSGAKVNVKGAVQHVSSHYGGSVDEHDSRVSVAQLDLGSRTKGSQECADCNEGPVLERRQSESIAPYQALPIVGPSVITRHLTAALPVLEPGENAQVEHNEKKGRCAFARLPGLDCSSAVCNAQEFDERVRKVIHDYMDRLTERTMHHMG